jgi:hypothetical protein
MVGGWFGCASLGLAATSPTPGPAASPSFDVVAGTRVNLPCQVDTPPQPDPNVGLPPGQKVVSVSFIGTLWREVAPGAWVQLATNAPVPGGPGEVPCGWPPYTVTAPGNYRIMIHPTQDTAEGDAPAGSPSYEWALDTSYFSQALPEKIVERFRVVARCEDATLNGVKSVTDGHGHSLSDTERMLAGLAGDVLGEGQTITAPAGHGLEVELRDGSIFRLGPGSPVTYSCNTRTQEKLDHIRAVLRPKVLLGKTWQVIITVLGKQEINYTDDHSYADTRGTKYKVTSEPSKQRTTIHVYRGIVALSNKLGRRRTIILHAGQTGVQIGKRPPHIV